jgi:hypothetical protein
MLGVGSAAAVAHKKDFSAAPERSGDPIGDCKDSTFQRLNRFCRSNMVLERFKDQRNRALPSPSAPYTGAK